MGSTGASDLRLPSQSSQLRSFEAEDAEFPDMAFIICKSNCALGSRLRTMFGLPAA